MPAPLYLLAGGMRKAARAATGDLLEQALLSTKKSKPVVAYLGSAAGDNREFFSMISGFLKDAGAGRVVLAPTESPRASMEKTTAVLSESDAVFVSGGDVEAGMALLAKRNLIGILAKLHRSGKTFVGISAGSIMLGRQWVRWTDPNDDGTAATFPCLGLAPLMCDTHAEDDEWEELRTLIRLSGNGAVGYGIPSGKGILVSPAGEPSALGGSIVRFEQSPTGLCRSQVN